MPVANACPMLGNATLSAVVSSAVISEPSATAVSAARAAAGEARSERQDGSRERPDVMLAGSMNEPGPYLPRALRGKLILQLSTISRTTAHDEFDALAFVGGGSGCRLRLEGRRASRHYA